MILYSDRNIPLILQDIPKVVTLTVENYCKWYDLYLVFPDGKVTVYPYEEYAELAGNFLSTVWGDQVINPLFIKTLGEDKRIEIDPVSYEVIVGRWVIEYEGKF